MFCKTNILPHILFDIFSRRASLFAWHATGKVLLIHLNTSFMWCCFIRPLWNLCRASIRSRLHLSSVDLTEQAYYFQSHQAMAYARVDFDTKDINSSVPGQEGRHFTDNIFSWIFLNEKFCILINISLTFVTKILIDNTAALVWIMAWRRTGDKPLSEPMLIQFNDAYMRH